MGRAFSTFITRVTRTNGRGGPVNLTMLGSCDGMCGLAIGL
jgi:hypothetical protein